MPSGTLIELMETAASGTRPAVVTYAQDGAKDSLADLLAKGRQAGAVLRARGVGPGEPVGILAKNGPGFLTAFFGALYADAVAVPLPLPFTAGLDAYVEHLQKIVDDAGIRHLVMDSTLHNVGTRVARALPDARLVSTGTLTADVPGGPVRETGRGADDLAVVQYTSGSTASPKGVALTHRNVVASLTAIRQAAEISPEDRWSQWLPLFHDMGLISVLTGLSTGGDVLLYQPRAFIRDPAGWLRRFAAERRTVTVAPNFAYDMLNAVRDDFTGHPLDLSAWRLAFNGAEPVRWQTVSRFAQSYADFGLRSTVMFPVYGMAEATVAVAFPPPADEPRFFWADRDRLAGGKVAVEVSPDEPGARPVADVGRAVPGVEIRVTAAGLPAGDGDVGEVEIRGDPVTGGYYRRPAGAEWSDDGWLRTGDLGFLLDGHLFIVGRSKNVMTVRGRNYFAEDVEAIVRTVPEVYRGRCAALAVEDDDGEHLGLLVETGLVETGSAGDAAVQRLSAEVRGRLQSSLGLTGVSISFVQPLSIPYTSSGKVSRGAVTFGPARQPA